MLNFTPEHAPQVVITEDDLESHHKDYIWGTCGGDCCAGCRKSVIDRSREESHGRKLAEALNTAEDGTTIEIAANCCSPTNGLIVGTSVRLIGTRAHHIRTWNAPLVVRLEYMWRQSAQGQHTSGI